MEAFFDHERLDVYRLAREFARLVRVLLEGLGRGHSDSKDNLKRAAKSITRNIAEGAGKWRVADKIHFYHIARASATECAACLDELVDFGLVSAGKIVVPKETLARVVAMLIAMIKPWKPANPPRWVDTPSGCRCGCETRARPSPVPVHGSEPPS